MSRRGELSQGGELGQEAEAETAGWASREEGGVDSAAFAVGDSPLKLSTYLLLEYTASPCTLQAGFSIFIIPAVIS